MVQRDEIPEDVNDIEQYKLIKKAMEQSRGAYPETPFGARKTAELDVQFGIDSSFGLTKERYGWYSNGTLFDSTFFTEDKGKVEIETSATSGDIARLRTAFPGQYLPHSVAEPGMGARIDESDLEYDDQNRVSLTHGEISFEIAQWDPSINGAFEAHGISFEADGAYHQVRAGNQNVSFVRQENWNLDTMDGTGPSGRVLQPELGYVYIFRFSWYGEGGYILAVHDPRDDEIIPMHRYPPTGAGQSVESPNMPVQATVQNKSTAEPLKATVGGMQFTTHGGSRSTADLDRTTEESRYTTNNYIDRTVSTTENAIDPFAQPGRPLISVRRDPDDLRARKGLEFKVKSLFAEVDQDVWVFVFDEYNESSALTGETFNEVVSRSATGESLLETDTQATDYTPSSDAVLRGMSFIATNQKATFEVTGDTTSRVPLEATAVVTAALATGANSTDAQPFLLEMTEQF